VDPIRARSFAGMFPNIPKQSGWGERLPQCTGLLFAVITELARDTPSFSGLTRLIDSTFIQ